MFKIIGLKDDRYVLSLCGYNSNVVGSLYIKQN